jgi:uncharacterized membrane protein
MAVAARGTRGGGSGGINGGLRPFFSYRIFISAIFTLLFLATFSILFSSHHHHHHHHHHHEDDVSIETSLKLHVFCNISIQFNSLTSFICFCVFECWICGTVTA